MEAASICTGGVVRLDHVHLIFTPLHDGDSFYSVIEITQGIKGASAHKINRLLNRSGQVWQRESLIEYSGVRAGLVQTATEYRWLWVSSLAKSA